MASTGEPTPITLGPRDAALVMRENSEPELLLPHREDDEELPTPQMLLAAFALGLGLQDQRMIDVLTQLLEEKRQKI